MDQEGLEPSSQTGKQCAFYTLITALVFELRQDRCYQPKPYPLKNFIHAARQTQTISDVSAPPDQDASEQQLLGDVSFQHLVPK